VSVGIEKLEGVASVRVSLEEGLAEVTLEPGNALDPEAIRDVARDGGFTPKSAEVRARGHLVVEEDTLALAVTGLSQEYRLVESDSAAGRLSALAAAATAVEVEVTGTLPESDGAREPRRVIEVRDFVLDEP